MRTASDTYRRLGGGWMGGFHIKNLRKGSDTSPKLVVRALLDASGTIA